jgi:hypothetical protein
MRHSDNKMNMDKMKKVQDDKEASSEAANRRPDTKPVQGTPVQLSVEQLDALLSTTKASSTLDPDALAIAKGVKHEGTGRPDTEPVQGTPVQLSVEQLDALLSKTKVSSTSDPDALASAKGVKHEGTGIEASTGTAGSLVVSMGIVPPDDEKKVNPVKESALSTNTTTDTSTFIPPTELRRQPYHGNVGAYHVGNVTTLDDISIHSDSHSPDQTTNGVTGNLVVANPIHDNDVENPEDLPQAEGFNPEHSAKLETESIKIFRTYALLMAVAFIALVLILLAVFIPSNQESGSAVTPEIAAPTSSPSQAPSQAPTSMQGFVLSLLPESTVSAILNEPESPQSKAFQWLMHDVNVSGLTHARIKQRFALATLFYATNGDKWTASSNWLNYSVHECKWEMKADFGEKSVLSAIYAGYLDEMFPPTEPNATPCDENGLFNNLWLDQNNLVGSVPLELYMLTTLKTVSFGGNRLPGPISTHIGQLTSLEGWSSRLVGSTGTLPR